MKKLTNGTTDRCGKLVIDHLNLINKMGLVQVWATSAICDNPGANDRAESLSVRFPSASYDVETDTLTAIVDVILADVIAQGILPADGTWVVT